VMLARRKPTIRIFTPPKFTDAELAHFRTVLVDVLDDAQTVIIVTLRMKETGCKFRDPSICHASVILI